MPSRLPKALSFWIALAAPAGAQIVIGGPDASLTPASGSWSWDGGPNVADFRSALENPIHFGPAGTVPETIETRDLATITAATLDDLDVFVATWWSDNDTTAAQATAVADWFKNGGNLLLYQDSSSYDDIADALGIPTAGSSDGSPSNGGAPLCDGPFGLASDVDQFFSTGYLNASDVAAHNGTVGTTNLSGEVTSAWWGRGDYSPGAGAMVICADVDMVSYAGTDYVLMNDQSRFALNGVAAVLFETGTSGSYGCGVNPMGSIQLLSENPTIGEQITFGLDNPLGTQLPGAMPLVAMSGYPDPQFPCGTVIPGLGMASFGADGELLIGLGPGNPFGIVAGQSWQGPGMPAPVNLNVPADPSLVGQTIYAQGLLWDAFATIYNKFGLTEALELTIGE